MTKDAYFEMCEALGNEPIEEEIPVEFEDLILEVQNTFPIYNSLQDNWDSMSGTYLGKNMAGLLDIFTIIGLDKEEQHTTFKLIGVLDHYRSELIASKKATKPPQ
jgi:hypothetical protein